MTIAARNRGNPVEFHMELLLCTQEAKILAEEWNNKIKDNEKARKKWDKVPLDRECGLKAFPRQAFCNGYAAMCSSVITETMWIC